jgi:hypothetical protein
VPRMMRRTLLLPRRCPWFRLQGDDIRDKCGASPAFRAHVEPRSNSIRSLPPLLERESRRVAAQLPPPALAQYSRFQRSGRFHSIPKSRKKSAHGESRREVSSEGYLCRSLESSGQASQLCFVERFFFWEAVAQELLPPDSRTRPSRHSTFCKCEWDPSDAVRGGPWFRWEPSNRGKHGRLCALLAGRSQVQEAPTTEA